MGGLRIIVVPPRCVRASNVDVDLQAFSAHRKGVFKLDVVRCAGQQQPWTMARGNAQPGRSVSIRRLHCLILNTQTSSVTLHGHRALTRCSGPPAVTSLFWQTTMFVPQTVSTGANPVQSSFGALFCDGSWAAA
jgi:hypothetical protein